NPGHLAHFLWHYQLCYFVFLFFVAFWAAVQWAAFHKPFQLSIPYLVHLLLLHSKLSDERYTARSGIVLHARSPTRRNRISFPQTFLQVRYKTDQKNRNQN